jgi:hypothetical protein
MTAVTNETKNILTLVQAISDFLHDEGLYDPDSDEIHYYDPKEWEERGELYGLESELIMTYEGNVMSHIMNPGYAANAANAYELHDRFTDKLHAVGFWVEPCTHWYAAFYPTEDS